VLDEPNSDPASPRDPSSRRRSNVEKITTVALILALTTVGIFLLAAVPKTSPAGTGPGAQRQQPTLTSSAGGFTLDTEDTATSQPTGAATDTPYAGPTPIRVTYASSSCQNMANSPYPYLNLDNTSQTEYLHWRIEVGNSAYTLWKGDQMANPTGPSISMFLDFVGPMGASGPLGISIYTNMGN
jgi:hypothetical protein